MTMREKLSMVAMTATVAATVARERFGPRIEVRELGEVPPSADAITAEWLTAVLCANTPGAHVIDVEVTGGSTGHRHGAPSR